MKRRIPDESDSESRSEQRRSAVKKILAASSVATGAGLHSWKTPLVETVVLPAHAQTTGPGNGNQEAVLSGQIGDGGSAGLLDLFMSPAYAQNGSDLVGGCIEITVLGVTITVTVTLNTSVSDTKSGVLDGCTSFTVFNVNGFTVVGEVDDVDAPTTCTGSVGPVEFSAVLNGTCSVIPATTTTTVCVPDGTTSCD